MVKRRKLKKQVWYFLVIIIFLAIGIYAGINIYNKYQYQKTYEYKLTLQGYSIEEAKDLQDVFKDEELDFFINSEKNEDYLKLLKEKYFLKKNFQKYLTYQESNKKLTLTEIVRNVNIHVDEKFYSLELKTNTDLEEKMLVNKYYLLDETYNPTDLVSIPTTYAWGEPGSRKIRQAAYDAFLNMWNEAKEAGFYLMVNSAYRTYEEQSTLYSNYKTAKGEKYADKYAARAGASEHQTGLSIDIFSKTNTNKNTFNETEEAKWLKDNAHRFGFILRYPDGLSDISGYDFEPWHFRYVGIEAATYCYENNILYEEYYAYFIEK